MHTKPYFKRLFSLLVLVAFLAVPVWSLAVVSRASAAASDLWVDAQAGSDANSGTTRSSAFRTIQAAANIAGPGTTVHILPGVYRESVVPAASGSATAPVVYTADSGAGTVIVRGSVPASSLAWSRLASNTIGLPGSVDPSNIYYADISTWGLKKPPRFVVQLDSSGNVTNRFMPAREPDWQVATSWKPTEFWWLANGGSSVAACDPTTNSNPNCDLPSRSYTQLTDTAGDTAPAGVQSGNLTTLGNLTGATLVAMDARHAHYVYRGTVTAHDVASGRITVNQRFDDDGNPGLGWGSKYYVENHPALLDQPGEWWFDIKTGRLYIWSPNGVSPAQQNIEISRRTTGFNLTNRSYTTLNGLTIELFNEEAFSVRDSSPTSKAFGDRISNGTLRYANDGVVLYQYMDDRTPSNYAIANFTLENSEVAYMDTVGIDSSFWWPNAPSPTHFNHAGVHNTVIRNNNLHDLGFNSDARMAVGNRIAFPDRLQFTGNSVDDTAHSGVHLIWSLISSSKQWGFTPQEIKLGNILVQGNIFDHTCQMASDCGALKFAGSKRPYTHVFRDALVTNNVFRNSFGWSYVSMLRGKTDIGDANGFYLDNASGVYVYRNIAYNNTGAGYKLSCLWRDGHSVFYNNIAANNYMFGFKLTGAGSCDNHNGSIDTQIVNNILVNNNAFGMQVMSSYNTGNFGNLVIDHNLYYLNGWDAPAGYGNPADIQLFEGTKSGQYFHTLAEIRSGTPWEDNGVEGSPIFASYDSTDHNRYDNSWPDFHLTTSSTRAIDGGTTSLPSLLSALLTKFNIADSLSGAAFDIGRFEIVAPVPAFAVTPASGSYGFIQTGTTSPAQSFMVKNTGNANMVISTSTLQGTDAAQFRITSDTCSGSTLAPAATCSIAAAFAPASTGKKAAYINIPDNAAGSPHHVALTGKGGAEVTLNGGFNTYPSTTAMIPTSWAAAGFAASDGKDLTNIQEGTASVRISNTAAIVKRLRQSRSVSGPAGSSFKLSLWARANNIPATAGVARAQVLLYNGTTLVQRANINFPTGTYGFAPKSLTFTASGSYNRVVIVIVYSKGSGTLWVDGLSLLKSP